MKINLLICCMLVFAVAPVFAEEDVEELKAQVQALQNRVNELEAKQRQPAPRTWDPFVQMQQMQEEMNDMFEAFDVQSVGSMTRQTTLSLDLKDEGDIYRLTIDTQGLNKDKLDVNITPYAIRVTGEYSSETTEENPRGRSHSQSFGHFMNSVPMPSDADVDAVEMEQKENKLVVTIPKK